MTVDRSVEPNNVIAAVSYVGFIVTGIIFLLLEPYCNDDYVRFHARQSIGFTVFWFVILIIFAVFIAVLPRPLGALLGVLRDLVNIALAVFWVFLMVKAYNGERYRIPQLSDVVDSVFSQTAVR